MLNTTAPEGRQIPANLISKEIFSVLIADDHAIVRAGYRQFLLEHPQVREIGEATSGTDTLAKLRSGKWQIVMLDISMPDRGGLDILERIRASYPDARVLVVSGLPEEQYAQSVLKMGAFGYLSKDMAGPELLDALSTVMKGRKYISPALAERLAGNLATAPTAAAHESLSTREFQIFLKVAAGKTVSDIAEELKLSAKTVSTYRSRMLEALNFTTNAEVTRYALQHGLIQ